MGQNAKTVKNPPESEKRSLFFQRKRCYTGIVKKYCVR